MKWAEAKQKYQIDTKPVRIKKETWQMLKQLSSASGTPMVEVMHEAVLKYFPTVEHATRQDELLGGEDGKER